MAIHGIVSTYFGDLEYDIGKSLTWTEPFCDSVYVLDVNTSDTSRQYVVDWDRQVPKGKYSFATDISYFGSPATAAAWRKRSFDRAAAAWNYSADDWVLFIDGTECLNVYHTPPVDVTPVSVSVAEATGNMTFTTSAPHFIPQGSRINIVGAYINFAGDPSQPYYEHTQVSASATWTISHNLHRRPSISALTTSPTVPPLSVMVTHTDRDTTVLTFPEAVTGTVTLSLGVVPAAVIRLDGSYEVLSVTSSTFTVPPCFEVSESVGTFTGALVAEAEASYTTEPPGFHDGDLFQSWIKQEIAAAEADGKSRISIDGWALIRSSDPQEVEFKVREPAFLLDANDDVVIPGAYRDNYGDVWVKNPKCSEHYLSMQRLVRLVKVSTLLDPAFNWTSLDQSVSVIENAYPAERLSLISYAYVRWAESPLLMTQTVDASAPNYTASGIPFRPTSIESDVGFAMRRLISTVRPISGAPTVWEQEDGLGEQPQVSSYQKLDTVWVELDTSSPSIINGVVIVAKEFAGYKQYAGTPLYPGVLRANRREGVWYTDRGSRPVSVKVASFSFSSVSGLVTIHTVRPHAFTVGGRVSVYGTANSSVDGQYEVFSVLSPTSFTVRRSGLTGTLPTTTAPAIASALSIPDNYGPVPWNYLLNSFGIVGDPADWISSGSIRTLA